MAHIFNKPLYQKIKEDILVMIMSKKLLPGDKLPTEHQLMAQYNVSRITVSKALKELKEEGTIIRYPNKGTFVTKIEGNSPPISEINAPENLLKATAAMIEIACILPTITDLFSLSMVNGVLSVFPEDTYICHTFQSRNPTVENYLLQRCLELNISGIILFPQDQPYFSNQLLYMQLQKYPLVLLDRYLPRLETSYVIADNRAAGEMCLRHLYELGHQRIAFVTASVRDMFTIKYRIAGISIAAESLNMTENSITIIDNFDKNKKFSYYQEEFHDLIQKGRITAFIAAESSTCSYLYELLSYLRFKIPSDISLISFDKPISHNKNAEFFSHISQSEHLMGRKAGMILRNRIEQRDMNVYQKAVAPTLEVRESTKPVVL